MKLNRSLVASFSIALLFFIGAALWLRYNGAKFVCNYQCTELILLHPHSPVPYYEAWEVWYSQGQQFLPNGKMKNLWCRPSFAHVDVSKLEVSR